jgi:hypothetical protein
MLSRMSATSKTTSKNLSAVVAPELVHPSRFRRRRDEFDDGLAETVQRGLQFKVTDHLVSGDQVIPNAISKRSAASLT